MTSVAAAALFMALVWKMVPAASLGLGWLALGVLLFELGLHRLPSTFVGHSFGIALLGIVRLAILNVLGARKDAGFPAYVSLGCAALLCYAITARTLRPLPDRISDRDRVLVRETGSWLATLFLLTVLWILLPAPVIAVAWALTALLLIRAGFAFSLEGLRLQGNLVSALTFGRLFWSNFTTLGDTAGISTAC